MVDAEDRLDSTPELPSESSESLRPARNGHGRHAGIAHGIQSRRDPAAGSVTEKSEHVTAAGNLDDADNAGNTDEEMPVNPAGEEADDIDDPDADAESTSSKAVYQLSVVSTLLGIGAVVACFVPKVPLTYALFAAIGGAVLGLIDCLSATVLHEPKVRLIAAGSTLICALAIAVVLVL
ncbi:hypothetical protein [Bifidobacterium vansinderenii]|uniref:Uncharacterized protein n=1 Tax=Bifidobacterium vansinderenii TaxID=1984871 RepID=A0A229VYK9_9BIFI|nr:hypothetical protein [Bifidobacterium vansinderenii]OXN00713.1 hypothetical protein Tam10B_1050 [Bifidobacterium vansinderenii]